MWFECARDNDSLPPTTDEAEEWLKQFEGDAELRQQVWHRFVVKKDKRNLTAG